LAEDDPHGIPIVEEHLIFISEHCFNLEVKVIGVGHLYGSSVFAERGVVFDERSRLE
jgi:hypothetical protein